MWSNDSFKLSHSPKVNVTPLFVGYQWSSPEALKKCRKWTNTCPSYFFTTKLRAFSPLRLPRVHMLLLLLLSSPLMSTDWRLPRLPLFYSLLLDQSEQSDADVVCTSLCAYRTCVGLFLAPHLRRGYVDQDLIKVNLEVTHEKRCPFILILRWYEFGIDVPPAAFIWHVFL